MANKIRGSVARDQAERPSDVQTEKRATGRFRPEGIALALSGVLFLIKALFDLKVGEPPSAGPELIVWRSAEEFSLAMTNEIMFFAVILLIPGTIGLYRSLVRFHPRLGAWGCALVAVIIPVMVALTIVHGRLAFPVYGIDIDDPVATQLVAALYYGGQHAVMLLSGVATILLALAMRDTPYGPALVISGLALGLVDFVGSYPWLLGLGLATATQLLFAGWFIAVGLRLARAHFA